MWTVQWNLEAASLWNMDSIIIESARDAKESGAMLKVLSVFTFKLEENRGLALFDLDTPRLRGPFYSPDGQSCLPLIGLLLQVVSSFDRR